MLHKTVKVDIGIVNQSTHAVDNLAHIVGRNIRCHTDGNTYRAVDKKIGKS